MEHEVRTEVRDRINPERDPHVSFYKLFEKKRSKTVGRNIWKKGHDGNILQQINLEINYGDTRYSEIAVRKSQPTIYNFRLPIYGHLFFSKPSLMRPRFTK